MDIISAYQQVGSYRAAAQLCSTTHKTVKRVVEKFEAGGGAPPRVERVRNYDAVSELVAERVAKSAGRMSAKRLLPIARAAGYDGSARNFRRLVAQAKVLWRNEHHRGRRPGVWSPGEYLVIDWVEAEAAIERLAAAPADEGLVIRDIWLLRLRALLARAHGDAAAYAHLRDRHRDMARTLGFEGHIAWAEAMP